MKLKLRICIDSDAAIEVVFNSGTYANEIFGSIYDIDGTTIGTFTGTGGYAGMQTLEFSDGEFYEDGDTIFSANAECQINEDVESGTDCDDSDSQTNPGAIEIWYNNVDNDCAGDLADDFDQDGDGQDSEDYGENRL